MEEAGKRESKTRLDNLALIFIGVAFILFFIVGAQLAGAAVLMCAGMAWDRPFEDNRAKGKPTLGLKGRLAVGAIMGTLAFLLVVTHDYGPSKPEDNNTVKGATVATITPPPPIVAKKLTPEETKTKVRELLDGERQMKREDVEGRLIFWDEIVALDPDNAQYAKQRNDVKNEVDALAPYREQPQLGAVITKTKGRREGFGNVLVIDITVKNRSRANLSDFDITCETFGASGTILGSTSKVLYERIDGRSEKTFRDINMGFINPQSKRSECQIKRALIG